MIGKCYLLQKNIFIYSMYIYILIKHKSYMVHMQRIETYSNFDVPWSHKKCFRNDAKWTSCVIERHNRCFPIADLVVIILDISSVDSFRIVYIFMRIIRISWALQEI